MFKKFLITLTAVILSFQVLADDKEKTTTLPEITDGQQYYALAKLAGPEKEVIEFFSFNSETCFKLDTTFNLTQKVSTNLPKNVKFKRYHLSNYSPLDKELAQAWAIANVLGIQDEIATELFNGIHNDKTIKTADDIKGVFVNLGIDEKKFENMKDNFLVKAFELQQNEAIEELQPAKIPSFYINGRYLINPNGLDNRSNESSINDYSRVINYLIELKD